MSRDLCGWAVAALVLLRLSTAAAAQTSKPIGLFAADLRGAIPRLEADTTVAAALGVASTDLPTRGLGLVTGVHWYPAHIGRVTLGVGGELLIAHASRSPESTPGTITTPSTIGPTVKTRMSGLSPQASLNFGSRDGWSYVSGGVGWIGFTTEREDKPLPDADQRSKTLNYGGGARWFTTKHLAFAVDLRFYVISPQPAATGRPAFPRTRVMVLGAGISLK